MINPLYFVIGDEMGEKKHIRDRDNKVQVGGELW